MEIDIITLLLFIQTGVSNLRFSAILKLLLLLFLGEREKFNIKLIN